MLYESEEASTHLYAIRCWRSRLKVADRNSLSKLICKTSVMVEWRWIKQVLGTGRSFLQVYPSPFAVHSGGSKEHVQRQTAAAQNIYRAL